jgi:hypothetical protein
LHNGEQTVVSENGRAIGNEIETKNQKTREREPEKTRWKEFIGGPEKPDVDCDEMRKILI